MDQEKIQAYNDQQKLQADEQAKTEDMALAVSLILESQKEVKEAIGQTLQGVVKFLNSYTPEVSVNNQQPFPTNDDVVKAVNDVVQEVKNSNKKLSTVEQKEADYTPIVKSLEKLAALVDKLPKQYPKIPEPIKPQDYTKKFDEVKEAVGKIPAPIVNVEKPEIPDNSKELKELLKAVQGIKFPPIPKTDFSSVEKAVKGVQNTISGLRFPIPNYVLPFKDIDGKAVQVQLDASGNIPTSGGGGGLTDAELRASPVQTLDNNKQSVLYYTQVLTSSDTLTPTSGKAIKLVKMQVLQNPDNSSANLVTLGFTSTGDFFTGWVGSDSSEVIGDVDEDLDITLAGAQPVSVMLRYKEI